MKKLILLPAIVGIAGFAGCGNGFLGLEDYQRDILGVLIANVGQQTVSDGLNCWDFSGEGMCDADEDWNGPEGVPDDMCDAWDCQGRGIIDINNVDGTNGLNCWDINANEICDEEDDWTGPDGEPDGICDHLDCQGTVGDDGADGTDGSDGVDGTDGTNGRSGGQNGADGADGQDGSDGSDGADGADGQDGSDGADGEDGEGDNCTTLCHCHGDECSTLVVPAPAVHNHLNHGDTCGPCEED